MDSYRSSLQLVKFRDAKSENSEFLENRVVLNDEYGVRISGTCQPLFIGIELAGVSFLVFLDTIKDYLL
jgi:hypothetical protein